MRVKRRVAVLLGVLVLTACSTDENAIGTTGPTGASGGSGGGAGGGHAATGGGGAGPTTGGSGGVTPGTGGTPSMLEAGPVSSTGGRSGAHDAAVEAGFPCVPPGSDAGSAPCAPNELTLKSTSACGAARGNASRVIAGLRAGFRLCYEQALSRDPNFYGTVTLTIEVAASGNVTNVMATSEGNLPSSVAGCMGQYARSGMFDAAGQPTTFVVSFYAGCGPAGDAMP